MKEVEVYQDLMSKLFKDDWRVHRMINTPRYKFNVVDVNGKLIDIVNNSYNFGAWYKNEKILVLNVEQDYITGVFNLYIKLDVDKGNTRDRVRDDVRRLGSNGELNSS